MKFLDWSLKVEALFEFADEELDVLLKLATESEDPFAQQAAQADGFIFVWKQMSQMKPLSRTGKVFFSASIKQLGMVTELLEADHTAESASLHRQFQEILTNSLTEQERVSPRVLEE